VGSVIRYSQLQRNATFRPRCSFCRLKMLCASASNCKIKAELRDPQTITCSQLNNQVARELKKRFGAKLLPPCDKLLCRHDPILFSRMHPYCCLAFPIILQVTFQYGRSVSRGRIRTPSCTFSLLVREGMSAFKLLKHYDAGAFHKAFQWQYVCLYGTSHDCASFHFLERP